MVAWWGVSVGMLMVQRVVCWGCRLWGSHQRQEHEEP